MAAGYWNKQRQMHARAARRNRAAMGPRGITGTPARSAPAPAARQGFFSRLMTRARKAVSRLTGSGSSY